MTTATKTTTAANIGTRVVILVLLALLGGVGFILFIGIVGLAVLLSSDSSGSVGYRGVYDGNTWQGLIGNGHWDNSASAEYAHAPGGPVVTHAI